MHKRSQFEKYKETKSPDSLMIRLNSQNTPPKFIIDILKNDKSNQSEQRKKAFKKSGSKSLDPNRRKIIDKKTLQKEYQKFLSSTVDQNNRDEQKFSFHHQTYEEKICLSKIIGKKYQVLSPF